MKQGDCSRANEMYEESLALARALENKAVVSHVLEKIGYLPLAQGDYARAHQLFTECLEITLELDDGLMRPCAHQALGDTRLLARRLAHSVSGSHWQKRRRAPNLRAALEGGHHRRPHGAGV